MKWNKKIALWLVQKLLKFYRSLFSPEMAEEGNMHDYIWIIRELEKAERDLLEGKSIEKCF